MWSIILRKLLFKTTSCIKSEIRHTCSSTLAKHRISRCRKNFFTTLPASHNVSSFQEENISENSFAYGILLNKPEYRDIVNRFSDDKLIKNQNSNTVKVLEDANFSETTPEVLCSLLMELGASATISIDHPSFDNLRLALINECQNMTDEQLAKVLEGLARWPGRESLNNPSCYNLWKKLDDECLLRWRKWKVRKVLNFIDLWYNLQLAKRSTFVYRAATKLSQRPHRFTPEELVALLFYLNILRSAAQNCSMFELEEKLTKCADQLSIDELGVAVMGFFKSNKMIYNEDLLKLLIEKVLVEIKCVSDITLTSIIKALRKSMIIPLWPRVVDLRNAIIPEIPRLSVQSCVHATLLTTKPLARHEQFLEAISQKVVDNISKCRLKDIEKTVFPLAQMAFTPNTEPCIFKTVIDELNKPERQEELNMYRKSLVYLTYYLCLTGNYPEDVVRKVLDMDFITEVYGRKKYNFPRELLCIDSIMELECPTYHGPRLPIDVQNYLSKKYSQYLAGEVSKPTKHQQWHNEIIQTAEILFGKEFIAVKYPLPNHQRADIIVHLDEKMRPLPLCDSIGKAEDFKGLLKSPGNNYYCLVVITKNLTLYNCNGLNGETVSKIKQLKILGYKPVLVYYNNWPSGSMSGKVEYLKGLLKKDV